MARLYSPQGEADYVLASGMSAIGEDDLGNLICMAVHGEDAGAMFFWDHETYEDERPLRRLADDSASSSIGSVVKAGSAYRVGSK